MKGRTSEPPRQGLNVVDRPFFDLQGKEFRVPEDIASRFVASVR
ncbi:hypothetical protein SAMN02990966_07289 [Rhodospirillales bacterium URHD0017]|nr:hypothetical protein SAMN02990966_07289 [Rhodospirillales bacterium URHD0017]